MKNSRKNIHFLSVFTSIVFFFFFSSCLLPTSSYAVVGAKMLKGDKQAFVIGTDGVKRDSSILKNKKLSRKERRMQRRIRIQAERNKWRKINGKTPKRKKKRLTGWKAFWGGVTATVLIGAELFVLGLVGFASGFGNARGAWLIFAGGTLLVGMLWVLMFWLIRRSRRLKRKSNSKN